LRFLADNTARFAKLRDWRQTRPSVAGALLRAAVARLSISTFWLDMRSPVTQPQLAGVPAE